jgi:hypothetical protein
MKSAIPGGPALHPSTAPVRFAPCPPNDFAEFIETYFVRCRERVPQIEANAGKWTFEDLIPGLSDFDTRFLVSDSMTARDWCAMSMEVGRVHLELAKERKDWARNLEHLPGVNLRWSELFDPQQFFTEFGQWSFYHGSEPRLQEARRHVTGHEWTRLDELYHWKKIAVYYGPYNRTIDPPINLGPFENKYSLHSRLMHYLAPPMHSAVCLMERQTTPGKLDAFRRARSLFPNPGTIDLALDLIARHYEEPHYLTEPGMTELDGKLESYLTEVANTLLPGSPLDCPRNPTVAQLKHAVARASGAVSFAQLFENLKFGRLMKGRLWFYAQDILWFDSRLLIRNELSRIRNNFLETPVRLFARLAYGKDTTVERALELLEGDVLGREDIEACRRFAVAARPECPDAELKPRAAEIADVFDPFLCAMERLLECAKANLKT